VLSDLGTVDKAASINFYILLAVGAVVVILAILLLTGVL
jgi:hypothetical protein